MSTRSAIAQPYGDGWQGRYHHSDGYPSGLGATLWAAYHETFRGDVKAMRELLIESEAASAGWSYILNRDLLAPATWDGGNGPRSYRVRGEEPSDLMTCACPSPEAESECDPLFIEWAYVLADHALIVFCSHGTGQGPSGYQHRLIGEYAWDGPVPDWYAMDGRP